MSSRQIRSDRKEKNAVMSFTVTDEPTFVDLTVSEVKEEVGAIVVNKYVQQFSLTTSVSF